MTSSWLHLLKGWSLHKTRGDSGTGNVDVVRLLIQYGARYERDQVSGLFPLHQAAASTAPGACAVADLLIGMVNGQVIVNETGISKHWLGTPLHSVAWSGLPTMVDILVQHSGNLEAKADLFNEKALTPLGVAAYVGNVPVFKHLIALGADRSVLNQQSKIAPEISAELA